MTLISLLHEQLNIAFEADLPEGAWFQHLQDTVENFNRCHGTSFDEYDTVVSYLRTLK